MIVVKDTKLPITAGFTRASFFSVFESVFVIAKLCKVQNGAGVRVSDCGRK